MSVLKKATVLIDLVADHGVPISLSHVAAITNMPRSSAHRLLSQLVAEGILRQDDQLRYQLGPRLLRWGETAAASFDLALIAQPYMMSLRDNCNESVHLYVRDGAYRLCIAAEEAHRELRQFVELGRPLPLVVGASGKLLLAFLEPETQRKILTDTEGNSALAVDTEVLRRELEQIRVDGWATSFGEREAGISAAATPIYDHDGRVIASLALSGPSSRLEVSSLSALRPALEESAHQISRALSADGSGHAEKALPTPHPL